MAANAASHVNQGSLAAIFNSDADPNTAVSQPVLQCVQVKPLMGQQGAPERFRVVFSDINNFVQSMLATQANHVVHDGKLRKGCFVRLKSYQANQVKGKRIIIVLDLDVLEDLGECDKIGEPKALEFKAEDDIKPQSTTIATNGFYGNKPGPQQNQQQSLPSRANPNASASHANIYPIEALSPYAHKWTIKARCTSKPPIRTWHNKNGEGKLFSVNLLDESGEIKATGFNDQCDALYDVFQEGQVYYITSPCRVNMAKKQFSNVNNDYELSFERDTVVEKAEEQNGVPQIRFNFTNIADLQTVEKDTTIDTIGILKEVGETSQIVSKTTSKPYDKRDLTLVDNTGYSVKLTIWGDTAQKFDVMPESVVAFKGLKVSDFGGRSLSLLSSGSMTTDPDIDEAHKLKGWYDAQGKNDTFMSHQGMGSVGAAGGRTEATKSIMQVKEENLGMSDNTDYFTIKATIIYVKQENVSYPACLSEGCNKKVLEVEPGQWRCERCDKTHPKPEHRYIMSINVSDHTAHIYLSCFDDVGRMIMGMSADQLMELRENDEKAAGDAFQEANCKTFVFKCRAKMDTYQDQQRVRYQVSGASPLNYSSECTKLTQMIKEYSMVPDIRNGTGPATSLFVNPSVSKPSPKATDAIVKIKCFGLNRMDLLQREGNYPLPPQAPKTLGVEFSGTIESFGSDAEEEFKVGDEVFGLAYGGAYAEYIAVSTHMLIHKPKELSWEQAAGVPETWCTATQAMYLVGEYASGKSILWHAGASSVSIAGIQLSKADKASAIYVTAGSQDKIDFCVKELGATAGFNYHTQDWAKEILTATDGRGVDLVIDFIGQNYFQRNLDVAARDGRIVHLGAMSGTKLPAGVDIGAFVRKRVRFEGSTLRSRDEDYQGKLRNTLVEHTVPKLKDGSFKVLIEKVFPWEDIVEAHQLMERNQSKGKIICRID